MTKNVMISLTGLQYAVEEADAPIEVISFGQYFKKGENHYLIYEDSQGGTELTKCHIKLSDAEMELRKQDALRTKLVFRPGEEYISNYQTPYGSLLVGVMTHTLNLFEEENFILAKLTYALELNGQKSADCTLLVKIQSCEENQTEQKGTRS